MKKILFICPYPSGLIPSQRFRFEQYISHLEEKGFSTVIKPFFSEKAYAAVYQSGNLFAKIRAIAESYFQRVKLLFQTRTFDFVFIHREATPIGPPVVEWILANVQKRNIIYDFDDAIWLTDNTHEYPLMTFIRWRTKVQSICKWSYKVSCGNAYLAEYAKAFNSRVIINPTTIDSVDAHTAQDKRETHEDVTIGWTGSHSTLKYLNDIVPVLQQLLQKYASIRFLVIADKNPNLPLRNYYFVQWRKESEVRDLHRIDIGVMPLPDDPWTRGKCGFKALQYMASSIPALVSPVGVNREIIAHGIDGYLCQTEDEWFHCLESLILQPGKRREIGEKGREKVIRSYSVASNSANFLSLFQ